MQQLHVAETEKYMHMTYFLNGGRETPIEGEEFIKVPSPSVFNYAQTPEMSAGVIRDEIVNRLNKDPQKYSLIAVNICNPDMLGHTGDLEAAIKAIEYVDKIVKDLVSSVVENGGACLIIADHGNCETMIDRETHEVHTAHTANPIPFLFVSDKDELLPGKEGEIEKYTTGQVEVTGILADVTPTILRLLGLEPADEMTGTDILDTI